MATPHVGDIGTAIEFTFTDEDDAVIDLAAASTLEATLHKPDGATVTKTLALKTDGSDGIARYLTLAGDFDQAGPWRAQGYVVTAAGEWSSDVVSWRVAPNL